jgi:hypothetical protein
MSAVEKSEVSRSAFVRRMVLRSPDCTLEQVQEAWRKEGGAESDLPKPTDIRTARAILKKKYKIKDVADIPRKSNGDINISALLRHLTAKYPNADLPKLRKILDPDGITFSNALLTVMKHYELKKAKRVSADSTDSPDENQDAGPRARRRGRRGRKPGSRNAVKSRKHESDDASIDLVKIEAELDRMILDVQQANHGDLVRALRQARRHVSSGILKASN